MDLSRIIISLLDKSVAELRTDLKKVESTWAPATYPLYVRHNSQNAIQVYACIEFKAYVPKMYHAWRVYFTEWDGSAHPQIDGGSWMI